MKQPPVSIIIVTYNSAFYLKSCLESILKITYPNKEIIIVDNNSTDETQEILGSYKNEVKIIYSKKNLGYAEGNNIGINNASGKYVFLLNPDTLVKKDFLEFLVETMEEDQKVGACQPLVRLMTNKDKINLTGKNTHYLGFDWIRDYFCDSPPEKGEIYSFSGCGVLLRQTLLKKIDAFDQTYFMYYEDTDLSWRMRLMGYKIIFIPESIIFHDYKYIPKESYQSLKRKLYYNERNRLITVFKNYDGRTLLTILPSLVFVEIAMIIYSLWKGWFMEKFKGYYSIIRLLNEVKLNRRSVQQNRVLSDKMITENFVSELTFGMFDRFEVKVLINPALSFYWKIARSLI